MAGSPSSNSNEARSWNPFGEYTERLDARRAEAARLNRLHRMIGNGRLLVFASAAALAWLAFDREIVSGWWLVVPSVIFLALVFFHERVLRARNRFERAAAFYEKGIARLEDRWAGTGETGDRHHDDSHPYSQDLDLFGKGSLFELLCTARTRSGEDTLARWLKAASSSNEIRQRHGAVAELVGRLDLREELAVLGEDVRSAVDPEELTAWAASPAAAVFRSTRIVAALLAALAIATLVVWLVLAGESLWFQTVLLLELVFWLWVRKPVRQIISAVEGPGRDLALLSQLLARFEHEPFTNGFLIRIQSELETQTLPPSRRIAKLGRLVHLLDTSRNLLFAPVALLLLWSVHFALAIEKWRRESGPAVSRWLAAVGTMEALCAMAGHAYEHPADPFPELVDEGACFDGEGLGHPLLAEDRSVRNSVQFGGDLRVLVVSGSNMSGKSTLLRTVGANVVLALAGAPVRARRLRLSPLSVGASIRIVDSLQSGTSRFYAEITRLRTLVDLARGPQPLLFLLDELLHGTNSHDRRIGAEAVVRTLVDQGAIGLVTTHDLALAHIAEVLDPRAANVHFEDHLENGRIAFDYILRPGIVQKSNALELMRSVGLDV